MCVMIKVPAERWSELHQKIFKLQDALVKIAKEQESRGHLGDQEVLEMCREAIPYLLEWDDV